MIQVIKYDYCRKEEKRTGIKSTKEKSQDSLG